MGAGTQPDCGRGDGEVPRRSRHQSFRQARRDCRSDGLPGVARGEVDDGNFCAHGRRRNQKYLVQESNYIPRRVEAVEGTTNHESQLWVMAAIAFAVFYSNYMVPPLIPALAREFSVNPYQLCWLIPGFLIPYGISTLVYGALSDRWGRTPVLAALLCFATTTM